MSEKTISPAVMMIEAHEELVQHIETRGPKIMVLSIISIAVAVALVAYYSAQLVRAAITNATVRINLLDPGLVFVEIVVIILAGAWLYSGVTDYLFTVRLGRQIKEAGAREKEWKRGLPNIGRIVRPAISPNASAQKFRSTAGERIQRPLRRAVRPKGSEPRKPSLGRSDS